MAGVGERAVHHAYGADDSVEHWRERFRSVLQTGRECGRIKKPHGNEDVCNDPSEVVVE